MHYLLQVAACIASHFGKYMQQHNICSDLQDKQNLTGNMNYI